MDKPQFDSFEQFFRSEILPQLIRSVEPALNHLRQRDPKQWLRIAMELKARGSYDRVENLREQAEVFEAIITSLADELKRVVPDYVQLHTEAIERHFVKHGQELDDLLKSSPHEQPMSAAEAVEAQLRAMGYNINPNDKR